MADEEYLTVSEIAERIRRRVPEEASTTAGVAQTAGQSSSVRLDELRRSVRRATALLNAVGEITPRPPGLKNSLAQFTKKCIRKALMWLFHPLSQFNAALLLALSDATHAMEAVEHDVNTLREQIGNPDSAAPGEGVERIAPERTLNPRTADVPKEIALIRRDIEKLHAELAKLLIDRSARGKSGQE